MHDAVVVESPQGSREGNEDRDRLSLTQGRPVPQEPAQAAAGHTLKYQRRGAIRSAGQVDQRDHMIARSPRQRLDLGDGGRIAHSRPEHLDGDGSSIIAVAARVGEVNFGTRPLAEFANESIAAEGVASHATTVPRIVVDPDTPATAVAKQRLEGMGRTGTRIDLQA